MFVYEKRLQYPVNIKNPNPKLAAAIISQYGGPDGELGASLRYLSQRYSMPYPELKGLLTDIGTEGAKWNTCRKKPAHPVGRAGFLFICVLDQNTVTVIDLMLDNLGCPAGEGLQPGLELHILIADLDGLPALRFAGTGMG